MRLIVADAAGVGWLRDKDGNDHQLDADSWSECDVRDTIFTGDGETAWVRYREDGRQVEVALPHRVAVGVGAALEVLALDPHRHG